MDRPEVPRVPRRSSGARQRADPALLYSGRPRNERVHPRTRRSAIALAGRIGRPARRPSDQTTALRRSLGSATREICTQSQTTWSGAFSWRRAGRPMRSLAGSAVRSRILGCARSRARRPPSPRPPSAPILSRTAFASTPRRADSQLGESLMPATVIVGLQWGDEGKGKTTDFLAEQVAMVVRYQGGDNAGHTVVLGDEVFKLQLTPSGVLYPHITSVIGNGVVVNPLTLIDELDMLTSRGIDVARVRVSRSAHVIMPYHVALDQAKRRASAAPRWARPGGGSGRPTPTGPGGSACGWRTCSIRPSSASGIARVLPDKNLLLALDGRSGVRARPARRPGGRLGRAPARSPRRHDLAGPGGARPRRARPARGRPGDAARPRPRQLPVRHVVEPGRRRRLHRWRDRPAPGRRGDRGHEGVLDARRLRPVPDRADR